MTTLRVPAPRLLPLTMLALTGLLALKVAALLTAASLPSREGALATAGSAVVPAALAASHEPAPKPQTQQPVPAAAKPSAPAPVAVPPPGPPEVSESERALLLDLQHRRQELEAREAALASRESLLSAAERRLGARVEELQALQTRLEAMDAARKEREEANWRGLVKLYESMKPRE